MIFPFVNFFLPGEFTLSDFLKKFLQGKMWWGEMVLLLLPYPCWVHLLVLCGRRVCLGEGGPGPGQESWDTAGGWGFSAFGAGW